MIIIVEDCVAALRGAAPPACGDPPGRVILALNEPIRLAGIFALTESDPTLGSASQYGVQVAFDQQPQADHGYPLLHRPATDRAGQSRAQLSGPVMNSATVPIRIL